MVKKGRFQKRTQIQKGHLPNASLGESGGEAIFVFWLKHDEEI